MASIDDLKKERSDLKRQVTITAKRVINSIVRKTSPNIIESFYLDLEKNSSDFGDVDESYAQLISEQAPDLDDHISVGGLDLEAYTSGVEQCYEDAKTKYDNYRVEQDNLKRVQNTLPIKSQLNSYMIRISRCINRVDEVLSKAEGCDNLIDQASLMVDRDDFEPLLAQVLECQASLASYLTDDELSALNKDVCDITEEIDQRKRMIHMTLALTKSSTVPTQMNELPASSSNQLVPASSGPALTAAGDVALVGSSVSISVMPTTSAPLVHMHGHTSTVQSGMSLSNTLASPAVSSYYSTSQPATMHGSLASTSPHGHPSTAQTGMPVMPLSNTMVSPAVPSYYSTSQLGTMHSAPVSSVGPYPVASMYPGMHSHGRYSPSLSSVPAASAFTHPNMLVNTSIAPAAQSHIMAHQLGGMNISPASPWHNTVPQANNSSFTALPVNTGYPYSSVSSMFNPALPSYPHIASPAPSVVLNTSSSPSELLFLNVSGAPAQDLKLKRTELPTFNGEFKHWPEYKIIWPRMAIPTYRCREQLARELRQSLVGEHEVFTEIRNMAIVGPHIFNKMWDRLCDEFDNQSASVEAALTGIFKLKSVQEDDFKSLVKLINEVESCHSQLSIVGQLLCLTMREVDHINKLLPRSIRTEWNRVYHRLPPESKVHPFSTFMSFLDGERKIVLRLIEKQPVDKRKLKTETHYGESDKKGEDSQHHNNKYYPCAYHCKDGIKHATKDCSAFKNLDVKDKLAALKKVRACFKCFGNHARIACKSSASCDTCGKSNHHTLMCRGKSDSSDHNSKKSEAQLTETEKCTVEESHCTESHSTESPINDLALYQIFSASVIGSKKQATVLTDPASNSVYITHRAAKKLNARKLNKYTLEVRTTGGNETTYDTVQYELKFRTQSGKIVEVKAFGMEKITGSLSRLDVSVLARLFPDYDPEVLQRQSTEVDILLGSNYYGLHPKHEVCRAGDNLSIMKSELGLCVVGSHPDLKEHTRLDANMVDILHGAHVITTSHYSSRILFGGQHHEFDNPVIKTMCCLTCKMELNINRFIEGEELGTQISPLCGACRCSKCPAVGHTYTFEEEQELDLIQQNLRYDSEKQCWFTKYPWIVNPESLPDNYSQALAMLKSTESRLLKNKEAARLYQEQIQDMIDRGVCRKLSEEEILIWIGAIFYICHLSVSNPKSKSTPNRIVFDSSKEYQEVSLNNMCYKGPNAYVNNLVGLLIRWREDRVAVVGDLKKMFNSVFLEDVEQHCHRWLWRYLDTSKQPEIYVMTRVNMGDRPAGAISTEAVYKTADLFVADSPRAADMLKNGSYVDDLIDSVSNTEEAKSLAWEAETMLKKGGFIVKFWTFSGQKFEDDNGLSSVLGIGWKPETDQIVFKVTLNFSAKRSGVHVCPDLTAQEVPEGIPLKLTRRMVLSQVMKMYDPLGLLSPFTLQAKVFLRETWSLKLGWDETLPSNMRDKWVRYFTVMFEVEQLEYSRPLKPADAVGKPMLVLMSDGSDSAYGFVAYARWNLANGGVWCRLIMSKCRIAPQVKVSTPKMELNGAVLSKRGRKVVESESRLEFESVLQLVDSETVLCMIKKVSYRFNLYEGVRIGEIQSATNGDLSCWAWVKGASNIADWTTRVKSPSDIGPESEWFNGPSFLYKPVEEWGIKSDTSHLNDHPSPGEKKVVKIQSHSTDSCSSIYSYERFSNARRVVWMLARIISILRKKSFSGGHASVITPQLLDEAKKIIVRDIQKTISTECKKKHSKKGNGGVFASLKPVLNAEGLWVIGARLSTNPMTLENDPQYLLPSKHAGTKLFMMLAHKECGDRGRDSTLARFRLEFWTPYGPKLAKSVKSHCQLCKLRDHKLLVQCMGVLPTQRLKPGPAFNCTMVDLFGPYNIRGEVQKRTTGKGYGVIFTDLVNRAVHIEACFGYDTSSFLLAFSRFVSVRGFPSDMYSDPGSQLVGADVELKEAWRKMDHSRIKQVGAEKGMSWHFSPADSSWYQGAVESLISGVKRTFKIVMSKNFRLSASEFLTACTEVANMLNERPLGNCTSPDSHLNILTPNCLLLGRATSKNPGGWQPTQNVKSRFAYVQQVTQEFWSHWIMTYAPSLVWQRKWHTSCRNLVPGDIVNIADSNTLKGDFRIGRVVEVFPSADLRVRKVTVAYKNFRVGEKLYEYHGAPDTVVTRSVQRLSLVVPMENLDE